MDKRTPFIDTLIELAEKDDKVVLIIPDVGFKHADRFQKKFPERYINLGVTEQSAVMIATGMALSGMKPYLYSMVNFVAFRPFEMVRNGIALHRANVKLIGVSGSAAYAFLGFSHNAVFEDEDLYHLSPYMDCYTPEYKDVEDLVKDTYKNEKCCYIRL